jgi:alpha-ketoglutarate-dependent taurine dioxygenase
MSMHPVLDDVQEAGLAVLPEQAFDEFVNTCSSIGEILLFQEVTIIPGRREYVTSPGPVPLHSDGPEPDVVAWYCVRQDGEDGTSILVDTIPVLRTLTSQMRHVLASIQVPYFDSASGERPKGYAPLLMGDGDTTWRVNYVPWLVPAMLDDGQRVALNTFQAALTTGKFTKVRLSASQSLFIDNWCVLHGRASVDSESPRLLKRAWLRTDRQKATQYRVRP